MPLLQPTLQNALQMLFADPGDTEADVISGWSQALALYTAEIVPPSANAEAAQVVLETALVGMSAPSAAVGKLTSALSAHATSLAAGMTPTGTPPAVFIDLSSVADKHYDTHAAAAAAWASKIDIWYRTGNIPGTPPTPWS